MTSQVPRRILVVEDHAPLLGLIAKSLQHAGYVVITAGSAERALVAMADVLPELIVSDVMMPGLDGYALVDKIRTDPRTDLIPIVFLTAKATRKERIKGLHAGIDAYLTKPFEPEELVAVIENIFSRVRRTHRRVARLPRTVGESAGSPDAESAPATPREPADVSSLDASLPTPAPSSVLTKSEQRVASLVAQGLSNKEIASRVGVSHRTVEMHLSNILAKKNLANRVELALLIAREFPGDVPNG